MFIYCHLIPITLLDDVVVVFIFRRFLFLSPLAYSSFWNRSFYEKGSNRSKEAKYEELV